jgi:hypothetical protein
MTGMTETRRWTGGRRGRARVAVGRLTAPRPLLWGVQARVERSTAAPEPGGAWKTSARSLVGMRGGGGWGGECRRDHGSRVAARPGGARVAGLRTGLLLTYGFFERAELPRGERFPRAPSGRIGGSLLTSGRPWAPRRVPPSPLGASWRARTSRTRARVSMYGWDSARGQDGDPTARGAPASVCVCVGRDRREGRRALIVHELDDVVAVVVVVVVAATATATATTTTTTASSSRTTTTTTSTTSSSSNTTTSSPTSASSPTPAPRQPRARNLDGPLLTLPGRRHLHVRRTPDFPSGRRAALLASPFLDPSAPRHLGAALAPGRTAPGTGLPSPTALARLRGREGRPTAPRT